jgi:hypothetical protein
MGWVAEAVRRVAGALPVLLLGVVSPAFAFTLEGFEGVTYTEVGAPEPRDEDHLEPGNPASMMGPDGYMEVVSPDLPDIHGKDVLLQVRVYPSFEPRYVLGIRATEHGPVVFRLEPRMSREVPRIVTEADAPAGAEGVVKDQSWQDFQETMRRDYARGRWDEPVLYCERALDPVLAQRVRSVWRAMILDTRPPSGTSWMLDGVEYHFSMPLALGGHAEAHTWSPPVGSRTWQLVDIADGMVRYCETARPEVEREGLETAVAALEAGLEAAAAEAATASPDPR